MSEEEVRAHNRRESWSDVANHLRAAQEAVGPAQGALDDLHEEGFAEQLQPIYDDLRRAANDATEARAR